MNHFQNTAPYTSRPHSTAQRAGGFAHIPVLSNTTSVCLKPDVYQEALRLAGGDCTRVSAALREAALEIALSDAKSTTPTVGAKAKAQTFSARVRAKALAKLRGAYRPGVVFTVNTAVVPSAADAIEVLLAVENNNAWAEV